MEEIFIKFPIEKYSNYLSISNHGRIYSSQKRNYTKIIKSNGLNATNLYNNGKSKQHRVDEIVYLAFNGQDRNEFLRHKDGDYFNDKSDNLEWVTYIDYLQKDFGSEWKRIKIQPNYFISKDGRVWSLTTNKILKSREHAGYQAVTIGYPEQQFAHIHRLIAEEFCDNPNGYNIVQYKDGNTNNICDENLDWVQYPKQINICNKKHEILEQEPFPHLPIELDWLPGYVITENGGIYSINKRRYLVESLNSCGYKRVECHYNNIKNHLFVHKLVAEAYLDDPKENQTQVNHKDLNKNNNSVENLEWCTPSENMIHSNENNMEHKSKRLQKQVKQLTISGELVKIHEGIKIASRETGVNSGSIVKVCKGSKPTAGGFKWEYLNK